MQVDSISCTHSVDSNLVLLHYNRTLLYMRSAGFLEKNIKLD